MALQKPPFRIRDHPNRILTRDEGGDSGRTTYYFTPPPLTGESSDDGWVSSKDFWKGYTGQGTTDRGTYIKHAKTGSVIAIFPDGNIEIYAEKSIKIYTKDSCLIKSKNDISLDAGRNLFLRADNSINLSAKNISTTATGTCETTAWKHVTSANDIKTNISQKKFVYEELNIIAKKLVITTSDFKLNAFKTIIKGNTLKENWRTSEYHSKEKYTVSSDAMVFRTMTFDIKRGYGSGAYLQTDRAGDYDYTREGLVIEKPVINEHASVPLPDLAQSRCKCNVKCYGNGTCTGTCSNKIGTDIELPTEEPAFYADLPRAEELELTFQPDDECNELIDVIVGVESLGPVNPVIIKGIRRDTDVHASFRRKRWIVTVKSNPLIMIDSVGSNLIYCPSDFIFSHYLKESVVVSGMFLNDKMIVFPRNYHTIAIDAKTKKIITYSEVKPVDEKIPVLSMNTSLNNNISLNTDWDKILQNDSKTKENNDINSPSYNPFDTTSEESNSIIVGQVNNVNANLPIGQINDLNQNVRDMGVSTASSNVIQSPVLKSNISSSDDPLKPAIAINSEFDHSTWKYRKKKKTITPVSPPKPPIIGGGGGLPPSDPEPYILPEFDENMLSNRRIIILTNVRMNLDISLITRKV